jgi:hypothetical protein
MRPSVAGVALAYVDLAWRVGRLAIMHRALPDDLARAPVERVEHPAMA